MSRGMYGSEPMSKAQNKMRHEIVLLNWFSSASAIFRQSIFWEVIFFNTKTKPKCCSGLLFLENGLTYEISFNAILLLYFTIYTLLYICRYFTFHKPFF